jgi:hypothetical protein
VSNYDLAATDFTIDNDDKSFTISTVILIPPAPDNVAVYTDFYPLLVAKPDYYYKGTIQEFGPSQPNPNFATFLPGLGGVYPGPPITQGNGDVVPGSGLTSVNGPPYAVDSNMPWNFQGVQGLHTYSFASDGDINPVAINVTVTGAALEMPPPLLSEASKQKLEAVTRQLDTLSRGFDILNIGDSKFVRTLSLKVANWAFSTGAGIAPDVAFNNSIGQAALAVADTVAGALAEEAPAVLVLGGVSVIYALAALVTDRLAKDPADGNFETVLQPLSITFNIPNATPVDDAVLAASVKFLNDHLVALTSLERYQGATLAGQATDAALQEASYTSAFGQSQADAAALGADVGRFITELRSDGFSDESFNASASLATTQAYIASAGLSDPFIRNLMAEGANQTDAQSLVDGIASLTAPTLSGTVFDALNGAASALTAYGNGTLACFTAGTSIAAEHGDTAVEALRVGDRVRLARGGLASIVWIGHRRVNCRRHPKPREAWPVRVCRDAFGAGKPDRELWLSPDHAVFIDGVLIPVRYLVNGRTVAFEPRDSVRYFHVELARHDILLAEGLPCESFLDTGNRADFDNGGQLTRMHPQFALRVWDAKACAPLVLNGAELQAARSYLLYQAEMLGHATTRDPDLRAIAAGQELRPEIVGRSYRFRLPADARNVRLVSRKAVPAEVREDSTDCRQLGVAVAKLVHGGKAIPLTSPRLGPGWHDVEYAGDESVWRWTDGAAGLVLSGGNILNVEVAITERYWLEEQSVDAGRGNGCRA